MIFEALTLPGAFRLRPERHEDNRGFFARTFCAREFEAVGLNPALVQASLSHNRRKGTLRGLHWQKEPHGEDKLVRVTRGAVWDVLVDIRPGSSSYLRWHGEELSADNGVALYIPRGFAHGFLTLAPDSDVAYQMAAFYEPAAARGARYDDPAFGIRWPLSGDITLSDKDAAYPPFQIARAL